MAMKHLLKLGDLSPAEITRLLDAADTLKRLLREGRERKEAIDTEWKR